MFSQNTGPALGDSGTKSGAFEVLDETTTPSTLNSLPRPRRQFHSGSLPRSTASFDTNFLYDAERQRDCADNVEILSL